jgi:glucose/arabinose dehydrogenase
VPVLPEADFDRMVELVPIPGSNDVAVVGQDGYVWRIPLGGASASLFGDISDRVLTQGWEEGLLGIAFSPAFLSDGRVYVYYSAADPRRSVLSRFQVAGGFIDGDSEAILLEIAQPYENHNGGKIAFGPDGYLYVALGDGGSGGDPHGNGQNLETLLASLLRLDVSGSGYTVPPSNPFVGTPTAEPEIYAYGLRNPWRFSFDRETGDLWLGDVGQEAWEEVDRIVAGGNYGWNRTEGFSCYAAQSCDTAGLQTPRAVYDHNQGDCSITGGYVYRGPSMPELDGWYVYGDFCTGRIWAVDTASSANPVLLTDTPYTISSFGELPNGEIVILTFENTIYELRRS